MINNTVSALKIKQRMPKKKEEKFFLSRNRRFMEEKGMKCSLLTGLGETGKWMKFQMTVYIVSEIRKE